MNILQKIRDIFGLNAVKPKPIEKWSEPLPPISVEEMDRLHESWNQVMDPLNKRLRPQVREILKSPTSCCKSGRCGVRTPRPFPTSRYTQADDEKNK